MNDHVDDCSLILNIMPLVLPPFLHGYLSPCGVPSDIPRCLFLAYSFEKAQRRQLRPLDGALNLISCLHRARHPVQRHHLLIIIQLYFTCTVRITESILFSSCLSVVPSTEDSSTPVSLHSVHRDVLDPTSLVLIASPVLRSPTIKRRTVVVVRALEVR